MSKRTSPVPANDKGREAHRGDCLHRVYRYLLELAEQKEAADRGEFGDQTRPAGDPPAQKPETEGV